MSREKFASDYAFDEARGDREEPDGPF